MIVAGLLAIGVVIAPTQASGPITTNSPITVNNSRPLIFPVFEGGNTVHMVRLGGTGDDAILLSLVDGQPGTDDTNQGRFLVTYARPATATRPLSGVSNVLGGWWYNGTTTVPRMIELENKVQADGQAQFWLEELTDTGAYPFLKMWREQIGDATLATNNGWPGQAINLDAYDWTARTYRHFLSLVSGTPTTPATLTVAPPIGGSVRLRATSFQSADGSEGATVTTCTSFKNGLCVAGF